jgi:hypothetical protein
MNGRGSGFFVSLMIARLADFAGAGERAMVFFLKGFDKEFGTERVPRDYLTFFLFGREVAKYSARLGGKEREK